MWYIEAAMPSYRREPVNNPKKAKNPNIREIMANMVRKLNLRIFENYTLNVIIFIHVNFNIFIYNGTIQNYGLNVMTFMILSM